MAIPSKPSFIDVAKAMNQMVPELAKNVKPLQPIMKEALKNKNVANGILDVGKRSKYFLDDYKANKGQAGRVLETLRKDTQKAINPIKKITDALQKGLFKDLGGKWNVYGSILNGLAGIAQAGFTTFLVLKQGEMQGYDIQTQKAQNAGIQDAFTRTINNTISIRGIRNEIEKLRKKLADDIDRVSANAGGASKNAREARQKANDALYEVRQGRKILEDRVSNAIRSIPNAQALQKQVNDIVNKTRAELQKQVDKISSDFQQQAQQQSKVQPASKQEVDKLATEVKQIVTTVGNIPDSIQKTFDVTQATIKQVVDRAIAPIARVSESWGVTTTTATITPAKITRSYGGAITVTPATVTPVQVTPGQFSASKIGGEIRVTIDGEVQKVQKRVTIVDDKIIAAVGTAAKAVEFAYEALKIANSPQSDPRVGQLSARITEQEKRIREQEKVNEEGNRKLDKLLEKVNPIVPKLDSIIPTIAGIPLIAGRAADLIRPSIPTIPQIEQAAATGTCRTTQPGGCTSKAINDAVGNAINNNNQNTKSILDALGTGADLANLALLPTINNKLGDQVPGGLSRLATSITKNQAISQIANLVTMAAAIHNCIQLSDNVSQTFFSILDNLFAIPTLIIDPEADTIDTQEVFNGAIENVMKSVFGVAEWAEIKAKWQSYNRIYQAATNSLNEIRSIGSSLNDAISTTATLTGRGFNALQADGILSDYNWEPTPENLRLKGGIFGKLGKLADGITVVGETLEAIESITSEIRSAVDSANQIKQNTSEMEAEVKKLLGEETKKRDDEIEALPAKSFSWEDLI